jgi:hypothetical protein
MSDYIAGLRSDLVDAAARHQHRGAVARRTVVLRPRAWSRPALAAVAMTAAALAVIAVAVTTIGPPTPAPTKPHPVRVVRLGLEAFNATYGAGGLWVAGTNGEVVQVARGRVAQRLTLGDLGGGIAATGDFVWSSGINAGREAQGEAEATSGLVQINGRSGAVVRRLPKHSSENGALEAGAGGLWLIPNTGQENRTIEHRDPATGRLLGVVSGLSANDLDAGDAVVWALGGTGELAQIDPVSDRVVSVVPGATRPSGPNNGATGMSLAADGQAVWVAGGTRGDVVLVLGGRVVRRLRVGEGVVDGVARTRDALWVTFAKPGVGARYQVIRIDPETGRQTGTVDLGHRQPTALVPAGRDLWIVTLDGTATLIR